MPLVLEAERLGFDSAWSAEAYGSDAVTLITWAAARTERIGVGTAIMQIPARSPAATAMTAITLDHLSKGRFRLGVGVSGRQVSEGWHGVAFNRPLERTREYVELVRVILGDDVQACRDLIKPMVALYVGGMGARGKNFYNTLVSRYGYEADAKAIQDLYLEGKKGESAGAVPDALVDEMALVGPKERIADGLERWRQAGVD